MNLCIRLKREAIMNRGFIYAPERSKLVSAKPPSLVDLCVQTAIDNVRYLGDVGETDIYLLERILPHCSVDELMHVENETVGRDLSQVTNKLWKRYYEARFGTEHTNDVVERMKRSKQKFTWRQLYQAKLKVQDEAQKQSLERLTQLYKKEDERRQSRQIRICSKAPPSSKKRCFNGGYSVGSGLSNVKSNIMKKAKIEYLNSQEIKNRTAIKRNPTMKSHVISSTSKPGVSAYKPNTSQYKSNTCQYKPGSSQFKDSASASRLTKKDREEDIKTNPGTLKGKAPSSQCKNSAPTSRPTKIDWDDDIRRQLSKFW